MSNIIGLNTKLFGLEKNIKQSEPTRAANDLGQLSDPAGKERVLNPIVSESYMKKYIEEHGGGGGGGQTTTIAAEQTFTAEDVEGMYMADLTLTNPLPQSGSIDVVYDGVLYNIPYNNEFSCFGEVVLVDDNPMPDFTDYPCVITAAPEPSIGSITVNDSNSHTIEITCTITEITITENGTYDIDGLETAIVNVPRGLTVYDIPLSNPQDEILLCNTGLNTFTYTYTNSVTVFGGALSIADITGVYLKRQSDNITVIGMSYSLTDTTLAITVKIYNNGSSTWEQINANGIAITCPVGTSLN